MGNRSTVEKQTEAPVNIDSTPSLNNEIIICGGVNKSDCYSYHMIKNQYKLICSYPEEVTLLGHCVVKLANDKKSANGTTLLSFGGRYKHTLVMKYVSVWGKESNGIAKDCNQWFPFIDKNSNRAVSIGRDEDIYSEVRAVIGGSNNNLLFVMYLPKNID
ncbi:hypothetical protein RFI_28658, partial [Reticulomyxa filosa]